MVRIQFWGTFYLGSSQNWGTNLVPLNISCRTIRSHQKGPLENKPNVASKSAFYCKNMWRFPKIRGTSLGVPIIRTIVFWGLYWGPLILGN